MISKIKRHLCGKYFNGWFLKEDTCPKCGNKLLKNNFKGVKNEIQ